MALHGMQTMEVVAAKPVGAKDLARLPDECWLRIFAHLEASELSGAASALCSGALELASQRQLWVALLYLDFCASLPQRAMLRAWLMQKDDRFHPRQLYVYKRREHALDLDLARAELQQRGEQAKEQDRKQRRLRALNFVLVRVTHLLLCAGLLTSTVFLWTRLNQAFHCSFYVVFAPLLVFEGFLLVSSVVAFTIFSLRGSSGWTFYWNRLRGAVRWLILYTSPCEGAIVLVLACSIIPLLACSLEGDIPEALQRRAHLRYAPPFGAFWLAALAFVFSLIRRRSFSASCVGSFVLLWLPLVSLSILLYLKISVVPSLPFYAVFAPTLGVTSLLLIFVGFLVVASFWLGYRGNRDWTEYATFTLLTMLTVLLPFLLLQLGVLARLSDKISNDMVFIPWVIWLSCLLLCTLWHVIASLAVAPGTPIDQLGRPWRHLDRDSHSDTELLLPSTTGIV